MSPVEIKLVPRSIDYSSYHTSTLNFGNSVLTYQVVRNFKSVSVSVYVEQGIKNGRSGYQYT